MRKGRQAGRQLSVRLLLMNSRRIVPPWAIGEFIGTFILVLVGYGSVATALLTPVRFDLPEVAAIWGIGVALAIRSTASLSGAHLNPAVTIAFAVWRGFPARRVAPYVTMQLGGAIAASAVLLLLFGGAVSRFEAAHGIVRGRPGSEASAMIFGEYYPNPGGRPLAQGCTSFAWEARAFAVETAGTAILLFVICGLTDERKRWSAGRFTPAAIGLTITVLICSIGPMTMACLNPARDLGPRLFSSWSGWSGVPFQANGFGWLTVYIVAPLAGAVAGAGLYHAAFMPRPGRFVEGRAQGEKAVLREINQSKSSIELSEPEGPVPSIKSSIV
jgi:glycerol uptake facilitator protein